MRRHCLRAAKFARSLGSIALSSSLSLIVAAGCGGNSPSPGDDDDDDDGGAATIDAAPATIDGAPGDERFSLTWGPITVEPEQEDTRCVTLRLANDHPIKVGAIHNTLGLASHHFIVYRITDPTGVVENTVPTPCTPFIDTLDPEKGAPLMITQRSEETLELPEGVAFTLAADQWIRLELHFVNSSDQDIDVTATAEFLTITEAEFRDEADFLFIGNPDINLADMPTTVQTLGPTYFPLPPELAGINVFALTGHTHKLGVDVQVGTTASAEAAPTMVYTPEDFSWSEPDTVYHEPAFVPPAGGGFSFSCSWINDTGDSIGFGENADDEMCFFWAYYYPSQGAKVCVHTDQVGSGIDICCPGSPLCALVEDFLNNL